MNYEAQMLTITLRHSPGKAKGGRVRKVGTTEYCGVFSERIKTPKPAARSKGDFQCIICGSRFTRAEGVNYHFPGCVARYGNPEARRWDDHPSCASKRSRRRTAGQTRQEGEERDEEQQEDEEREEEQRQDEEQEDEKRQEEDELPTRYNPATIASDVLRAIGEHPYLPPLNSHVQGFDEGLDLVPSPSLRLRLQNREPSNEATQPSHPQPPPRPQENNNAENVRTQQQHSHPTAPRGSIQAILNHPTSSNSTSNQTPASVQAPLNQPAHANNPSNQLPPTPQPSTPLPPDWVMRTDPNLNLVYFANQRTGIMTLDDPRAPYPPRAFSRLGALPPGWRMALATTPSGPRPYFVDNNTQTNTWDDPRGPMP